MFRHFRPLVWLTFLSALGWKPMTEDEWLACADPRKMLDFLRVLASQRKLRLFACACCRTVWDRIADERSKEAVAIAESFADRRVNKEELGRAYLGASDAWVEEVDRGAAETEPLQLALDAARETVPDQLCLPDDDARVTPNLSEEGTGRPVRLTAGLQVRLLSDIFGNPFRPARLDLGWLTWDGGTVPKLAQSIYDDRAFDRLPVLADALEDAGCADAAILEHCRSGGDHARGCWVIDRLLGKE